MRPTADEWRNSLGLVYEDPESFQLVVLWQDDFTQESEILDNYDEDELELVSEGR